MPARQCAGRQNSDRTGQEKSRKYEYAPPNENSAGRVEALLLLGCVAQGDQLLGTDIQITLEVVGFVQLIDELIILGYRALTLNKGNQTAC